MIIHRLRNESIDTFKQLHSLITIIAVTTTTTIAAARNNNISHISASGQRALQSSTIAYLPLIILLKKNTHTHIHIDTAANTLLHARFHLNFTQRSLLCTLHLSASCSVSVSQPVSLSALPPSVRSNARAALLPWRAACWHAVSMSGLLVLGCMAIVSQVDGGPSPRWLYAAARMPTLFYIWN